VINVDALVLGRLDRIADELAGIRQVLETLVAPDAGDATTCLHPDEARVQLGGMGETDGFHCRACGLTVEPRKVSPDGD
jgi:hypothetical protein